MRDTDSDWKRIGETDPYWGVYTCDLCRTENLTEEAVERLYGSGINDVRRFRTTFQRYFGADFRPRTALDFGCGVGHLVLAIAPHVDQVTGVDVAPGMLARARERAQKMAVANASFAEVIPDGQFDWVNTFIVLQHVPPGCGMELIDRLAHAVCEGGFLSLHVTAFHLDGASSDPNEAAAGGARGAVRMYDYPLSRVCEVLYRHSFADLYLDSVEHDRHVGYIIYGRKSFYLEARTNYSDLEKAPARALARALFRKAMHRVRS